MLLYRHRVDLLDTWRKEVTVKHWKYCEPSQSALWPDILNAIAVQKVDAIFFANPDTYLNVLHFLKCVFIAFPSSDYRPWSTCMWICGRQRCLDWRRVRPPGGSALEGEDGEVPSSCFQGWPPPQLLRQCKLLLLVLYQAMCLLFALHTPSFQCNIRMLLDKGIK